MTAELRIRTLDLLGGHPALDFVNTLDWRAREPEAGGAEECLVSYDALLVWAQRSGLLTSHDVRVLQEFGRENPSRATAALGEATALRETLHSLFRAALNSEAPAVPDMEFLNRWLPAAGRPRLVHRAEGFALKAAAVMCVPTLILERVAQSAAELLSSHQMLRVGCCAGPGCGWLYLDTSPNRRRRWCSMQSCGNRAKAQRHYNLSKRQKHSQQQSG